MPPLNFNQLAKPQVITLLKNVARKLGHPPSYLEFRRITRAGQRRITRLFGGYRELLQHAGFEPRGPGYLLSKDQLLLDWAAVTRKLGRVPTVSQYKVHGKYGQASFSRQWRSWQEVPAAMLEFAASGPLRQDWNDVLSTAHRYLKERERSAMVPVRKPATRAIIARNARLPRTKADSPVYGHPIMMQELATAPVNEAGVIFLFGALAKQLGFLVLRVQQGFPDVEALRRGADGVWRWVRIELEYESRNFLLHGHDVNGCDLIVCWKHTWPSCPVEVVELSKIVER